MNGGFFDSSVTSISRADPSIPLILTRATSHITKNCPLYSPRQGHSQKILGAGYGWGLDISRRSVPSTGRGPRKPTGAPVPGHQPPNPLRSQHIAAPAHTFA